MNGKDKLTLTALVLTWLGGLWLAAAPWIVDYQSRTGSWATGSLNEFWVGLGLVAVTTAALVAFTAHALRSLRTAAEARRVERDTDDRPVGSLN